MWPNWAMPNLDPLDPDLRATIRHYCVDDRGGFDMEHNSYIGIAWKTVRDRRGSNQWNTCSSLGSTYKPVPFIGIVNNYYDLRYRGIGNLRVSRYKYYYRTRCKITFKPLRSYDIVCTGSDSIKSTSSRSHGFP